MANPTNQLRHQPSATPNPVCPTWCRQHDYAAAPNVLHIAKIDPAVSSPSGIDEHPGPVTFTLYRCDQLAPDTTMIDPKWVIGDTEIYADCSDGYSIRFTNLCQADDFDAAFSYAQTIARADGSDRLDSELLAAAQRCWGLRQARVGRGASA